MELRLAKEGVKTETSAPREDSRKKIPHHKYLWIIIYQKYYLFYDLADLFIFTGLFKSLIIFLIDFP